MSSLKKLINPNYWSSYVRDISFQSRGNVLAQIINVIAMPIITRIFNPEIYGRYAIAGQLIAGISIFLSYRLEYFIVSNNSTEAAIKHLKLIIRSSFVKLVFLFSIILILKSFDIPILDFTILEIALILILSWAINISIASQNYVQFHKQFKTSGNSEIWNKGGFTLLAIILGNIIPSLTTYLIALITGFTGKVIFIFKRIQFKIRDGFTNLSVTKEINRKASSLSIIGAIQFFVGFIPLYYLKLKFSLEEVGFFNIATTLLFLPVGIIANAIGQVYFQRISEYFNNNNGLAIYQLTKTTITSAAFISSILFTTVYFLADYIDIFLGSSWKDANEVIKLFCFSSFFSFTSITIDRVSFALKKTIYPIVLNFLRLFSVCATIYYSIIKDLNYLDFMQLYVFQLCLIYVGEIIISISFSKQHYNLNR